MAVISAIRKRQGLVLGLIAVAIIGFVVMDMTSGGQGGQSNDMTLVKVAGKKVEWKEMLQTEEILYSGSDADVYSRRQYLYNYFVEKAILEKEAKALGIGVTPAEMAELQFGANKSPIIQARFADPNTGMINQQQLNDIRQQITSGTLTPELRAYWSIQEKEIIKDRLESKLNQLINKGLYAPTFLVEENFKENNDKYEVEFVKVNYDAIPDSEVDVTDKAISDFIAKNKNKYKRIEETRKLSYGILDVLPTAKDSTSIFNELAGLIEDLKNAENDTTYVEVNAGIFDPAYQKKEEFEEAIADELFGTATGDVYGPYIQDGSYRIAKVVDKKMIPDSVKSRHILLRANSMEEAFAAQQKLDSIKTAIQNGTASFSDMAIQFSQDGSAQDGGDLGYASPGMMVKPFNDFIFFNGKIGQPDVIFTQFGLHLVEVLDRKFGSNEMGIQLAILTREIVPSEETQNETLEKALDLVSTAKTLEDLKTAASAAGINMQTSQGLARNDFQIGGVPSPNDAREIIRWAFGNTRKEGEVCGDVFSSSMAGKYYTEKYIIVGLSSIIPAGIPSGKHMRDEISLEVKNHLKAQKIIAQISGKTMDQIVSQFGENATRETATDVSFSNAALGSAGVEPKAAATAIGLPLNQESKPIEGFGGVFVVKTLAANPGTMADVSLFKSTSTSNARRQFEARFMQALKEKYDIKDNRFKFY
jgi:peptidyl-prolyl cis-trans isomerase D